MSEMNRYQDRHDPDSPHSPEQSPSQEYSDEQPGFSFGGVVHTVRSSFDSAYTSEDTALGLLYLTPRLVAGCYVLLVIGIIISRLHPGGFIWGTIAMLTALTAWFFWLCCSNARKVHNVSEKARNDLSRAMWLYVSVFLASMLAMVYFFGMAFSLW